MVPVSKLVPVLLSHEFNSSKSTMMMMQHCQRHLFAGKYLEFTSCALCWKMFILSISIDYMCTTQYSKSLNYELSVEPS